MNEIILDPRGNTYVGPLAQRFLYGEFEVPKVFNIDSARFHVFECVEGGIIIHRASQSSMISARSYMTPNRVLVYSSTSTNPPEIPDSSPQLNSRE